MKNGYFLYPSESIEENYLLSDVKTIYEKMSDDLSKDIYINRLLYSMTLNTEFIKKIVVKTKEGQKFLELLRSYSIKSPILVYGAGKCGMQLVEIFSDIEWSGFIDENKAGSFKGIEIKKLKDYQDISSYKVIVSNQVGYAEIKEYLKDEGGEK